MKKLIFPCIFGAQGYDGSKKVSCILTKSGRVNLEEQKYPLGIKKFNIPVIRGIVYFFYGFVLLVGGLFEFGDKYNKDGSRVMNKAGASLNVTIRQMLFFTIGVFALIFAILVFGKLPIKLSHLMAPDDFNIFLKRLSAGLIKIVLLYIIFLIIKFFPSVRQYYKFNSALIDTEGRENNYLTFLVQTVFFTSLVISLVGFSTVSWYFLPLNLLITMVSISVGYELYLLVTKNKYTRYIIYPFLFLIYEKPSQKEQKCVNIVLSELSFSSRRRDRVKMEKNDGEVAFSEAYVSAQTILKEAGRYEKSDLDFIFCEVCGKNRAEIKLLKTISNDEYKKVIMVAKRRAKGEPITKIFGHTNFYGIDLKVTKDVLSPRIDTERLVEETLKVCTPKARVLDIGTGSGAIAIAVAKNSKCRVLAVDVMDDALAVARANAKNAGATVEFKKSDLFSALGRAKFDVIVSNPPYIPSEDIGGLDIEVKNYDPLIALDGGDSGLDFYSKIIELAPKYLNANGKLLFEVGIGQAKDVKKLLQKNFKDIRIVKDYNKIDRVVVGTLI